jgi:hypothetical protein
LAIDVLGSGVSDLLAADVEYRIHLIAQEAKKFMVQGKRSTLLPEDIEQAMAALNVEVSLSDSKLRTQLTCLAYSHPTQTITAGSVRRATEYGNRPTAVPYPRRGGGLFDVLKTTITGWISWFGGG